MLLCCWSDEMLLTCCRGVVDMVLGVDGMMVHGSVVLLRD